MAMGKGLGGCYTCIKYLMFAFNFIFWLLGCAILGVGIWIRVDDTTKKYVTEGNMEWFYTGAYIMIAIGVIIMILGFLGCCGAIRESQCMLATFFVILFIIFACLLGAGIWAVVNKDQLKGDLDNMMKKLVNNYKTNQGESYTTNSFLFDIQNTLNCCGAVGKGDYGNTNLPKGPCKESNVYITGCTEKIDEEIQNRLLTICGICIGVGLCMIFGMIFSLMLCCAIREVKE